MTLRSTRQFIESLGTAPGDLRVTRQLLETLGQNSSDLRVTRQFIDVLVSYNIVSRTVLDSCTFSETLTTLLDKNPKIYDTLAFTEQLPIAIPRTISEVLVLTDQGHRVANVPYTEVMDLVDTGTYILLLDPSIRIVDSITFGEVVEATYDGWQVILDSLTLTDTYSWIGPHYTNTYQHINFQESNWHNNNFRQAVADLLTLTQVAGRYYTASISDSLTFVDDGYRKNAIADSLVFNDYALCGKKAQVLDLLTLQQVTVVQGSFIRTTADSLQLGQSIAYYYITPCIDKQYHPFVGDSNVIDQPASPDLTAPMTQGLLVTSTFQLLYPSIGGTTDSVTLRAPELDARDRGAFNRINRETRGGYLRVFADVIWPKVTTIACTFTGLLKAEISTLQEFILTHIGEEIRVIDWEQREWRGVVIKPNEPATCDGKHGWSIGFEFEGYRVADYDSGLALVLTDTATNLVWRRPSGTDSLVFNQETTYRVD